MPARFGSRRLPHPAASAALHPSDRARLRAAQRSGGLRRWVRAVLIAAPIVALVSVGAGTALEAMDSHAPRPVTTVAAGSAAITTPGRVAAAPVIDPDSAAPAEGATGTIALPPEPIDLPAPASFDTTVTPARPFSMAGASAVDRGRALECLATAIYYEAASESDDGQRAVAQVVLNRVRHSAFPGTVCGVVYQGSEKSGCQFSFACDGAMARLPSKAGWARAARIAAMALAGQVFAPVGLATHYHTYAVTPAWNRTLVMTDAIGAHFFHRWKGYWGTAAAFSQTRYRGGEPVPGPHPRAIPLATPAPLTVAAAPAMPVAPPRVTAPAQIQPAHADSGTALADTGASQILDRWKDSGKPLR